MAREVRIYTTLTCPYCRVAKKFLDDNGVKYQEFDIAKDKVARQEAYSGFSPLGISLMFPKSRLVWLPGKGQKLPLKLTAISRGSANNIVKEDANGCQKSR